MMNKMIESMGNFPKQIVENAITVSTENDLREFIDSINCFHKAFADLINWHLQYNQNTKDEVYRATLVLFGLAKFRSNMFQELSLGMMDGKTNFQLACNMSGLVEADSEFFKNIIELCSIIATAKMKYES